MTAESDRPHIGIVGSGPAGFYTAQQILKVSSSKVSSCVARPSYESWVWPIEPE